MEDDFPDSYDDDGDVLVKKESDNERDDRETIPFVSPKRENDIDFSETIPYTSPRRESEDEIDEKIYKQPQLETQAEIEQQGKLEQNKLSKEAEPKKLQDVFDEVKNEESLENIETFFIPDNDIFDSDDISEAYREFIMDLNQLSYFYC